MTRKYTREEANARADVWVKMRKEHPEMFQSEEWDETEYHEKVAQSWMTYNVRPSESEDNGN